MTEEMQVGVRLDGITDQMRNRREGFVENTDMTLECPPAVDVNGCSYS
jgi:hypothetical protein